MLLEGIDASKEKQRFFWQLERGRKAFRERCPGLGSVADNSQGVDWTISLRKPKCEYPKIPSSPTRLVNVIGVPRPSTNRERRRCSSHTRDSSSPCNRSISHSEFYTSHPGVFFNFFWVEYCGLTSPNSCLWALTRLRFSPSQSICKTSYL